MQDVVGIRVVGPLTYSLQDQFVNELLKHFDGTARTYDRRASPSHGYRAMHVVPRIDGYLVEIQVRTPLQHAWANATESIADKWGRGVRYGKPPLGSDDAEIVERTLALGHWRLASDAIVWIDQEVERLLNTLASVRDPVPRTMEELRARLGDTLVDQLGRLARATLALSRARTAAGPEVEKSLGEAVNELTSLLATKRKQP